MKKFRSIDNGNVKNCLLSWQITASGDNEQVDLFKFYCQAIIRSSFFFFFFSFRLSTLKMFSKVVTNKRTSIIDYDIAIKQFNILIMLIDGIDQWINHWFKEFREYLRAIRQFIYIFFFFNDRFDGLYINYHDERYLFIIFEFLFHKKFHVSNRSWIRRCVQCYARINILVKEFMVNLSFVSSLPGKRITYAFAWTAAWFDSSVWFTRQR